MDKDPTLNKDTQGNAGESKNKYKLLIGLIIVIIGSLLFSLTIPLNKGIDEVQVPLNTRGGSTKANKNYPVEGLINYNRSFTNARASFGYASHEESNAWFLNQLNREEYESLRDNLNFPGFLYIGWVDCPFCEGFAPVVQQVLYELDMLDDVRSWDLGLIWDEDGSSEALMHNIGVEVVPALIYFTPGGSIRRFVIEDFDNIDIQALKAFLTR